MVVKWTKAAQGLLKNGLMLAEVWYRVEMYTHAGPDSQFELCCEWVHIENKCGNKPTCGCWSGQHQTSEQKCNMVGCTAKQGSLCGHTVEKCPNCNGSHIAVSIICTKKAGAHTPAQARREIGQRASMHAATEVALGTHRVVLVPRLKGPAEEAGVGGSEAEMADVV
jgi:hypothetical protein